MQPDLVRLERVPREVEPLRPPLARADAVLPAVAGNKAWSATAPSKSLTIYFYGTVTPTETGSRLDVRMTVMPHGPLRLLLPLISRRMQQQELDNMRFIKGKLEDGN